MFVLFFFFLGLVAGQEFAITAAPTFLFKRQQRITDCDGPDHALWTCPNGECYWGDDGFVGCCSLSSCAPRTRCIEYDKLEDDQCDHNTGGCVVCSKSESPSCVFLTNPAMKEYGYYCDVARRTGSSSFEYDLPAGAVIRTIKDTQEAPITTETDSEETDTTTEDDFTIEGGSESETGTTTDTTATEATTTEADGTSSGGTTDPTATDTVVADASELTETKGKLRSAIAAAAALGAIVGTLILLAIAFIWYRKRAKRQEHPQPTARPMVHSQPSSVPGYSHQYYETVSNPPSASVSPPNTSFGGSAVAPSPTSRAGEQMPHIPELGRYRY
ncbi:hypothetical protein NCS52_01006500 [Fusarium sp. LHS14.1]|nr:hypothetical protein NCS52_01006500 [Fusarium sp. LHS14.1]